MKPIIYCGQCDAEIKEPNDPIDGWQIESGETICTKCCGKDLSDIVKKVIGNKNHINHYQNKPPSAS